MTLDTFCISNTPAMRAFRTEMKRQNRTANESLWTWVERFEAFSSR
jgi:hypothetical protein